MSLRRALLVVALGVACYANALGGSFHFDDGHAVQENPGIRSLANLGRFFTDVSLFSVMPQNQSYRPVLLASYAATAAISGVQPGAFIAVNLLVHIACALLVYAVLRETLRLIGHECDDEAIAFLAALIFAVHPLFSECVNYVSARSESLSGALLLTSLYAYLRGRRDDRWMTLAVIAIVGALLVKPTASVLPILLALLELAAAERRPLRQIAPWLGVITACAVVVTLVGVRLTPALTLAATSGFTRAEYLRSELPAVWHYVRLFLWPVGQSADPDYPVARSLLEPQVIAAGLALLATAAFAAWRLLRRRFTGTALASAWFLVCLAPSSSLMPLAEIVNEHRPYLAAASLCALLAALLIEAPRALGLGASRARSVTLAASVLVLAALGTATVLRNRVWRSELTLWEDVVSKAPESSRAHTNLGVALLSAGRLDEAEFQLREAVRLYPRYAYAQMSLGKLLLDRGQSSEALSHLDRAVALDPDMFWAQYQRGLAAEQLEQPAAERIGYFSAATGLSPSFADAWYHLALALDTGEQLQPALEASRRAVALRGSFDDRLLLAYLLLKNGNAKAALQLVSQLQLERPGDPRTQTLLLSAGSAAPGAR